VPRLCDTLWGVCAPALGLAPTTTRLSSLSLTRTHTHTTHVLLPLFSSLSHRHRHAYMHQVFQNGTTLAHPSPAATEFGGQFAAPDSLVLFLCIRGSITGAATALPDENATRELVTEILHIRASLDEIASRENQLRRAIQYFSLERDSGYVSNPTTAALRPCTRIHLGDFL